MVKVQSCYNNWEEAGPCESVVSQYNSVIMIGLSNINLHSHGFDKMFVITLLLAYAQIVDPDGGIYSNNCEHSLQAKSCQYQVYFLCKN